MGLFKFFRFSVSCVCISDHKVVDCGSDDGGCCSSTATATTVSAKEAGSVVGVRKFAWEEVRKRTKNFSRVIGSGGFSTVYLARLPDSTLAAVKIQSVCTERLSRIHEQELHVLLRVQHPNIVKLLGYCEDREEERMLLLEYVPNGTLHDKLHVSTPANRSSTKAGVLTWEARTRIAFQLAKALEYLHGIQIIHGDIKASNILLDEKLNGKLCDFGSAKLGFTSMVLPPSSTKMNRMIMGSQGYVDPHYLKTGLVSKKNDVYSYGVLLLELVTGKEAFSFETGVKLTEIAGPVMRGEVGVEEMVDPRLRYGGGFDLEEAKAMVSIAGMCIGDSPMIRPSATQIIISMKEKIHFVS